jgi:asparagine synthase (glutamine-hydrolysing)
MCGISGYIGKLSLGHHIIKKTLEIMKNRGPDNQDFFFHQDNSDFVYLLSSRLSIIDLNKKSNQPFRKGDYVIVYNGEIYNYLELRKNLVNKGIRLTTSSDTEVLLNYFILYKEECLKYFDGMWSFAIYNIKEKKIFFSRDRFGEKPFYYLRSNNGIYFGSEVSFIKTLYEKKLKVNYDHLIDYLSLGYKSLYKKNKNFFLEICQLKAGHYVYEKINSQFKQKKFWSLNYKINNNIKIEEAIFETKTRTIDAIRTRLRADVPVAICLSGGIDSGIIASVARKILNKKIKTFSILDTNDARYNEKENILSTIKDISCDYELIDLAKRNKNKNFESLVDLINYRNAPIATISYFLQSLMLEKIKSQEFKVSLLGTAADEIFAGYFDHHLLFLNSIKNEKKFKEEKKYFLKDIKNVIRNPLLKDPEKYSKNPLAREHIYDGNEELKKYFFNIKQNKFIEKKYCKDLLRNRMLNELFCETTPVILNEDDLNSMYYSIENRTPFLQYKLVEFIYTVPTKYLINNGFSKYLLRSAFQGVLNDKVRNNKKKIGFNSSVDSNFDLQNSDVKDYFFDKKSNIFEFLKIEKVKQLYEKKIKDNYESKFIFNFINAKIFLDKNL